MKKLTGVADVVATMAAFCAQVEAFMDEVDRQFREQAPELSKVKIVVRNVVDDCDTAGAGWVYIAQSYSIEIKAGRKSRYVSFIVELTTARVIDAGLQEDIKSPLVHVVIGPDPVGFTAGKHWIITIPPSASSDGTDHVALEDDGKAWVWRGNETDRTTPFDFLRDALLYSYSLEVFTGPNAIANLLITPLVYVLNGAKLESALAVIPVLTYREVNDAETSQRSYRLISN